MPRFLQPLALLFCLTAACVVDPADYPYDPAQDIEADSMRDSKQNPPKDQRPDTPPAQRCVVGQGGCECGPNQPCEYRSDADPNCDGEKCDVVCPGPGNTCKPRSVGDNSTITCRGDGATCEPVCTGDCVVVCEITDGTCKPSCRGNAECELQCPGGGGTCEFDECKRGARTCGDGRIVCNRSC